MVAHTCVDAIEFLLRLTCSGPYTDLRSLHLVLFFHGVFKLLRLIQGMYREIVLPIFPCCAFHVKTSVMQ